MENSGLVSIILLNYNGKQFNRNCIDSILRQTYNDYEIIFVDNKSIDGSLEQIERCFKREIESGKIKIVKNDENMWFAGGNNSGVQAISEESEYVRLLNNDTEIEKDCLKELIKGIKSDGKLGAVSSVILDKGYEELIELKYNEGKVRVMNVFGVQIWENSEILNDIYYTNFLCGCSFLYKRKIIDKPFFDFYKIYCEDTQLSWEILYKGYKLGICKKSIVNHYGSATMNKMSYNKLYLGTRNSFINFFVFLGKKMRIKLLFSFIIFHCMYLLFNFKRLGILLKVDINSIKRVISNKDEIKNAKNRIDQGKVISEIDFLKTMSYKLLDSDLYTSKILRYFINILNFLTKIYFIVLGIPYRDYV